MQRQVIVCFFNRRKKSVMLITWDIRGTIKEKVLNQKFKEIAPAALFRAQTSRNFSCMIVMVHVTSRNIPKVKVVAPVVTRKRNALIM